MKYQDQDETRVAKDTATRQDKGLPSSQAMKGDVGLPVYRKVGSCRL